MNKLFSSLIMLISLMLFISTTSSIARATVFRIELLELEREYQLGESLTVPVDLGTALADLTSIQVEISGVHSNGWWVGDRIEHEDWDGPVGNYLSAWMNYSPVDFWSNWTNTYDAESDGQFTTTLTLSRIGGGSDWSFLRDGITDLHLQSEGGFGWGSFSITPLFYLTNVTVVINATPVPEPSTLVLLAVGGICFMVLVRRRYLQTHC